VASPTRALPEHLVGAKVGDLFKVTEDFNNPDGNDGVLLVKRGDIVELVETSDLWWWMRRDFEEGWVLPDVIAPVGSITKRQDPPVPPPQSAKPSMAPNPFSNGKETPPAAAVFNPFQPASTVRAKQPTVAFFSFHFVVIAYRARARSNQQMFQQYLTSSLVLHPVVDCS